MNVSMHTPEQDRRLAILNTLLTTPHRNLSGVWPVHEQMLKTDPLFYARLAAWYDVNGEVRDHKEMFVICLCLSDFPGHRDCGLAMLREFPPYQVQRVVDFIHGRKKTARLYDRKTKETVSVTDEFGLFKNVPRSVTTEVTRYLREREAEADWFDSSVLVARKSLKRLYSIMHIEPSSRAQEILFENVAPQGSKLAAVKALREAQEPADQARVIIEQKVPYRVASTVVSAFTPTVVLALIEVMSDQELINNLGSLRRRGALQNDDLKQLVAERLEAAKTGKRVSALKSIEAAKASGVDDQVKRQLEAVADTQVKAKGRIARSTALLIDKSSSMSDAIELGKRVGALASAIMDAPLFVYAFDNIAYEITPPTENELSEWERAFVGISAGGMTSCGVAIEMMRRKRQAVEQIIMITDEGENTSPYFINALQHYRRVLEVDPHLVLVKCGGYASDQLEKQCTDNGVTFDAYQFDGDYYSLPGMIRYLTAPSRLDLLMEIMSFRLPQRRAA